MNKINSKKKIWFNLIIFLLLATPNLSAKIFVIDHLFKTDRVERQSLINRGVILDADIHLCEGTLYIRHDKCTDNKNEADVGEHSRLSNFLETLSDNNVVVSIDVKSGQKSVFETTLNLIKKHGLDESRFIFWIRSHRQASYVRKYSQKVKVAYWAGNKKLPTLLSELEDCNSHNIFMIGVYTKKKNYREKADYVHNTLGLKIAFHIFNASENYMLKKSDFVIVDKPLNYVRDNLNDFKEYYTVPKN